MLKPIGSSLALQTYFIALGFHFFQLGKTTYTPAALSPVSLCLSSPPSHSLSTFHLQCSMGYLLRSISISFPICIASPFEWATRYAFSPSTTTLYIELAFSVISSLRLFHPLGSLPSSFKLNLSTTKGASASTRDDKARINKENKRLLSFILASSSRFREIYPKDHYRLVILDELPLIIKIFLAAKRVPACGRKVLNQISCTQGSGKGKGASRMALYLGHPFWLLVLKFIGDIL